MAAARGLCAICSAASSPATTSLCLRCCPLLLPNSMRLKSDRLPTQLAYRMPGLHQLVDNLEMLPEGAGITYDIPMLLATCC